MLASSMQRQSHLAGPQQALQLSHDLCHAAEQKLPMLLVTANGWDTTGPTADAGTGKMYPLHVGETWPQEQQWDSRGT